MGIGIRSYIVKEDNNLVKVSSTKLEKMYRCENQASLPDYAGQNIKLVNVIIDNKNRKPYEIIKIECTYLRLNDKGQLDSKYLDDEMRCIGNLIDLPCIENRNPNVVDAYSKFAKRKLNNMYTWKLTSEIEASIYDKIFNNKKLHLIK
ncbi:MAG: hypothetical protein JEY91_18465 [Spirochaetaceae bacterium]|nr:hypothetical protein [Spirochaetaceae bacterium]